MVNVLSYVVFVLMGIFFSLAFGNIRWKLPLLTIANRWFRWIFFSFVLAYFVHQLGLSKQPFFVLISTFFLGWFLVESIFIWINIRALNRSSIALFPKFSIDYNEINWPNLKRFIQLRDFLRSNGFKQVQAIKTTILGSLILRALVYKDTTGKILLQLIFLPQKNGVIRVYYVLTSLTANGKRFITDNLDVPFGGYLPNGWLKVKKPLCDSLGNLWECHLRRLNSLNENFIVWGDSPINEINHQQSVLKFHNIKKGFLNPPNLHEDYGKLTSEGCYRLWKQFLFLKYTGISLD